jgi:hypothetical protein
MPLKLALQVRLKLVKWNDWRSGRNCRTFDYGNNVRIQAIGVGRNVKDEENLQGVQHLDIMIIVSLTYTLKLTENRCRIRRIKKNK